MDCKKIFCLKQKNLNIICTVCPKSALRGGKTKFLEFYFHRDVRKKTLGKVKNFQEWIA